MMSDYHPLTEMMKTKSTLALVSVLGLSACATGAKAHPHLKLDTNRDGLISQTEFLVGHKDPNRAKTIFASADTNNDGQLDKTELAALRAKQESQKRHHQAAAAH